MSVPTYKPCATAITCREDDEDAMVMLGAYRELERENAALRAELAPLRETVGVAATASTCADDLSNWSKLVERADNSTRLERENAALRKALEFAVAAYKEEDWPYVMADNFYAVSCVARIALNGKEAQP